jgi:hypothetical protein
LHVPKIRTVNNGSRRFDYAAAELWNSLPLCLKRSKSVSAFKKGLKTNFFGQAMTEFIFLVIYLGLT